MREAIALANQGAAIGEVPVGAVVVLDGQIIGRGFNQPISTHDPTAHAEVVALRDAARAVGNYRLTGDVGRDRRAVPDVHRGLRACPGTDPGLRHRRAEGRRGRVQATRLRHPSLNHRVTIVAGVLAEECRQQMRQFFQERRR